MKELNQVGKEEFALAILLWKDFKASGKFDVDIIRQAMEMAIHLGVLSEYEQLMVKMPPLKIVERYKHEE